MKLGANTRRMRGLLQYARPYWFRGTIALIEEGDSITIDAHRLLLQLNVGDDELARRRARWKQPAPRYTRGLMSKYMRLVSTASKGAITDGDGA